MADPVEIKDRALEWYLRNPLAALRDVSEEFDIPYETVRDWSKQGGWVTKRVMRGAVPPERILRQADGIREVLFDEITSSEHTRELPDLVKAWKSTLDIHAPAEKEETIDRDSLLGNAK